MFFFSPQSGQATEEAPAGISMDDPHRSQVVDLGPSDRDPGRDWVFVSSSGVGTAPGVDPGAPLLRLACASVGGSGVGTGLAGAGAGAVLVGAFATGLAWSFLMGTTC